VARAQLAALTKIPIQRTALLASSQTSGTLQPQDTLMSTMELATIPDTELQPSRIALGTWAIGGWMWGGTDDAQAIATIKSAVDRGITLIDTAPAYGFGHAEELVGQALAESGARDKVCIATKVGLDWNDGKVFRNASRARIQKEVEDSLRRLRTDFIDLYQLHWPDPKTPIEETAEAMLDLYREGKIRTIGVSKATRNNKRVRLIPLLYRHGTACPGHLSRQKRE
jgi:aryl-alcohol dehydrogenase-like predicted oxidoreductase